MRKFFQISGIAGVVLTLFGLTAYFFTRNLRDPYVLSHLVLGAVFLLIYLSTQGGSLLRVFRHRSARYRLDSLLYSLTFLGILVMLNFISSRHNYRWDLTENQVFSLSSQSVKILQQLKQELQIYGFFERGENLRVSDLVKSYQSQSPKITFTAVDPDRHPEMARKFKIQQINTLHIRYGQESTNITEASEENITNAIVRLAKARKKDLYFLTGHGEPRLDDRQNSHGFAGVKEALANESYQAHDLVLATEQKVPEEAALLMIASPSKPLLAHERESIENYIKNGGRILFLLPSTEGEDLKNFVKEWGVEAGDDIVVDQVVRLFGGPTLGVEPITDTYSAVHPITRNFTERTIFPMVRSVDVASSLPDGVEATSLVQTSSTSWAEKDLDGIFKQERASLGPKDKRGPVSIGVAVTVDLKRLGVERDGEAKMVVLGTAGFANNRFINIYFNRDFFLNVVNWLVGEESLISIRPRSIRSSRIQLTEKEGMAVFYLSFLVLPELLLIIGLGVWWRRK